MSYKREDIYGTTPLDIKKINDNMKMLWLKTFGNIDIVDMSSASQNVIYSKATQADIDAAMNGTLNMDNYKTVITDSYINSMNIATKRLVASDGNNKVVVAGDGTVQVSTMLYGLDSGGTIGLGLFPQAGLVKSKGIQAMFDNNTYTASSNTVLALGKAEKLTGINGVIDTNMQVGNGGSGSGIIAIGYLTVTGNKNSLQLTEDYGDRLINAYETAEYYFGDIGYGVIGEDGTCIISIDEIFQECVNVNIPYHVFTQTYNGNITSIDKQAGYFTIRGEIGTEFSWEIKAKRKGYEQDRLEIFDIGQPTTNSNIEDELNLSQDLENELLEVQK